MSDITLVVEGLKFPEGPIAMPDGSLLVVEIARGTLCRVYNGEVTVVAKLGGGPNGAAMGPGGHCYVCNNGGFSWVESSGGRLFPGEEPDNYSGGRIEKINLRTGEVYVTETPTGRLWAYELEAPGKLKDERRDRPDGGRLIPGRQGYFLFDSLAVDAEGNVCIATIIDGGITILKPKGGESEHVPMPDRLITNICFGGDDLRTAYITLSSTGQLVSMPWSTPGLPLNFLNK